MLCQNQDHIPIMVNYSLSAYSEQAKCQRWPAKVWVTFTDNHEHPLHVVQLMSSNNYCIQVMLLIPMSMDNNRRYNIVDIGMLDSILWQSATLVHIL